MGRIRLERCILLTSGLNFSLFSPPPSAVLSTANSGSDLTCHVALEAPFRPRSPRGVAHDMHCDDAEAEIEACDEQEEFLEAHLKPELRTSDTARKC